VITFKGKALNQRQLNAITPVMNRLMRRELRQSQFDQACIEALELAGCPLGYDTGIDPSASLEVRALRWASDGDVGVSSMTIYRHMLGLIGPNAPADEQDVDFGWPHDVADLNRCLGLLALIPEWKPRMVEMAAYGGGWKPLAENWDSLEQCFLKEAGLNWSKTRSAPETFDQMRRLLDTVE